MRTHRTGKAAFTAQIGRIVSINVYRPLQAVTGFRVDVEGGHAADYVIRVDADGQPRLVEQWRSEEDWDQSLVPF